MSIQRKRRLNISVQVKYGITHCTLFRFVLFPSLQHRQPLLAFVQAWVFWAAWGTVVWVLAGQRQLLLLQLLSSWLKKSTVVVQRVVWRLTYQCHNHSDATWPAAITARRCRQNNIFYFIRLLMIRESNSGSGYWIWMQPRRFKASTARGVGAWSSILYQRTPCTFHSNFCTDKLWEIPPAQRLLIFILWIMKWFIMAGQGCRMQFQISSKGITMHSFIMTGLSAHSSRLMAGRFSDSINCSLSGSNNLTLLTLFKS